MRRLLCTAGFVALVAVWAVFLRPQFLGGDAAYVTVSGTSMQPRMHTGDIVLLRQRADYRVGDVVAYRIPRGEAASGRLVIHRIVGGAAATGFEMRGDNRTSNDFWRPRPADIMGAAAVRIPALGLAPRVILSPVGLGLLAGLAVFVLVAIPPAKSRRRARRAQRAERELELFWATKVESAARDRGAATGRRRAAHGSPRCDYGRLQL